MNQVAGLGGALDSALDRLLRERQRAIAREATWIGGDLAAAALLFGALSVIAFLLIHRRVAAPARALVADPGAPCGRRPRCARRRARRRRAGRPGRDRSTAHWTSARRSTAELHARNERLRQYQRLVEHSRDRFCIVDSDACATCWRTRPTRPCTAATGASPGRRAAWRTSLDPEFLEREARPPIERCLAGEPQSFEAERTYAGIGTRRFLIRYDPLPDADGRIRQVAAVMTDITEQRRLDERVREFHQLIEGTDDLCAIFDHEYRYLWTNRAYREMYGLEAGEVEGRTLAEIVGEHHFDEPIKAHFDRCLDGEPQRFEFEREFAGVGTRRLLVRQYPIELPDIHERRVGVVLTDVTDIHAAEAELARQARLLDMAGQRGPFRCLVGGPRDRRRVEWSDVVADIHGMPHGYSPSVDEGIAFYAPEYRDRIRERFTACAEQGVPYDEELQIINADGERVWVRTVGEPVRDEDGRIVRVQGAFQDISTRKAVEQEAQRLQRAPRGHAREHHRRPSWPSTEPWRYSLRQRRGASGCSGYRRRSCWAAELLGTVPGTRRAAAIEAATARGHGPAAAPATVEDYFEPLQRWLDLHVYPWEDGVAVFFRDVTDQHRMLEQLQQQEAELRQSRDQLDAALDVAPGPDQLAARPHRHARRRRHHHRHQRAVAPLRPGERLCRRRLRPRHQLHPPVRGRPRRLRRRGRGGGRGPAGGTGRESRRSSRWSTPVTRPTSSAGSASWSIGWCPARRTTSARAWW
ncbi:MAG: PAS domain S-box protein [Halofilum sp. (in: g-proteobacteria)]|nr:PAS domain S-box protein [Halofilum sp. (in: g-proteobacteria)]